MEQFEGKVAVVTGAASGIGRAMTDAFVAKGMNVVMADIESEALEKAAQEVRGDGGDVFAVTADVSKAVDVERIAEAAVDVFGGLHVACNNAGVATGGLTWEIDEDSWTWILGVNLWGVIHGVRSFTPRIISSGGGHIVNTASMAGLTSPPGMSAYNVTKHAVVTMSETMSVELEMTHPEVGVSVLCPGWVRTQIHNSTRNRSGWVEPEPDEAHPLGAMKDMLDDLIAGGIEPSDVAALVVDAIATRRFYVLTHPEWQEMVRQRVDRMLDGQNPQVIIPGN